MGDAGVQAYPICIGVMFWPRLLMIQSDPTMISMTMRTPKASASTLLALSGPVVMWMKKTRCTPDLGDRQHHQRKRDAGSPDQVGACDEKGDGGDESREEETNR